MAKAKCVHHVHTYYVAKGYEVPCRVQSGMERKCVTLLTPCLRRRQRFSASKRYGIEVQFSSLAAQSYDDAPQN